MSKVCPACTKPASGRFCSHCGTTLTRTAACAECSAALKPGVRFCNSCGAPAEAPAETAAATAAAAPAAAGGGQAPWIIAAVAVVALLGVVLLPRFRDDTAASPAFAPAMAGPTVGPTAGPQGIDLASMTPQERADRLYDRIMRTLSTGDTVQALGFLPMALDAYAQVPTLDADARYHLATLHLLNGDPAAARLRSDQILATDPNHLFGLFTAAQAADRQGNRAEARALFQRFLDNYATEITRDLPEYAAHSPAFPEMRSEAQAYLQGGQ
jgi:tetratricopeptide (TPR) repeat protein